MSCFLSHSAVCSDSRGISEYSRLIDCKDSIESHLSTIHLSTETITECELILARLFDLLQSNISDLLICPKHRHSLGKYWKQKRPCQYPTHKGSGNKAVKGGSSVNLVMSKDIFYMEYMYSLLLAQVGYYFNIGQDLNQTKLNYKSLLYIFYI